MRGCQTPVARLHVYPKTLCSASGCSQGSLRTSGDGVNEGRQTVYRREEITSAVTDPRCFLLDCCVSCYHYTCLCSMHFWSGTSVWSLKLLFLSSAFDKFWVVFFTIRKGLFCLYHTLRVSNCYLLISCYTTVSIKQFDKKIDLNIFIPLYGGYMPLNVWDAKLA